MASRASSAGRTISLASSVPLPTPLGPQTTTGRLVLPSHSAAEPLSGPNPKGVDAAVCLHSNPATIPEPMPSIRGKGRTCAIAWISARGLMRSSNVCARCCEEVGQVVDTSSPISQRQFLLSLRTMDGRSRDRVKADGKVGRQAGGPACLLADRLAMCGWAWRGMVI
eukprot:4960994-Pleurochrysis_carterae.AAC.1